MLSTLSFRKFLNGSLIFAFSLLTQIDTYSQELNTGDNLTFSQKEVDNFRSLAAEITIIRDTWGVPHIYATTDAQCAFGIMYAQCEDNFWQVEETMIRQLGRSAELYGESQLGNDAEVALFECVKRAKEAYKNADPMVRSSCLAAADGINFYIYTNPAKIRLIKRYEPWFFLLPSANGIGHGITREERRAVLPSTISSNQPEGENEWLFQQSSGSNTLAISSSKASSAQSILVINPHVGFFGIGQRYEAHLVSKQGLNVSGFAILGTFYIWSGFTDRHAWAHTNTGSDYQDVYLETMHQDDSSMYLFDNSYHKLANWQDTIAFKSGDHLTYKVFNFSKTHHGPVAAKRDTKLITVRSVLDDDPAGYILQSLRMCKARSFKEFQHAMSLHQLATNTMYADRKGNIAYWHGNRIPVRNNHFNWKLPVDGSIKETEWKRYHSTDETIHFINPSSGYLQNCNSTPFLAPEPSLRSDTSRFPSYMAYDEQTLRAQEMLVQLSSKNSFSVQDVAEVITSKNIPVMRNWLSQIIADYHKSVLQQPDLTSLLSDVIDTLARWDYRMSLSSSATTLAFAWHTGFLGWLRRQNLDRDKMTEYSTGMQLPTPPGIATELLVSAVKDLNQLYGTPFVEWQKISRLQRVHTGGSEKFDDNKPSIPVNAAPGIMGSLFSFNLRFAPGAKTGYGVSGNTYTAIVALGKKLKARSIVTFGQSSDPASQHYIDQANLYADGKFKDAWYYKKDILRNARANYHPGQTTP
jgi:acyl-homoserine-lactone acylase